MTRPSDSFAPLPPSVADAVSQVPGLLGIAAESLDDGVGFAQNPTARFPQASAIKVPILATLYDDAATGKVKLDERLEIDPLNGAGGCGVLQHFQPQGSALSLADLANLMIAQSDNVATNLIIDHLGRERVNQWLAKQGLRQTRLERVMMDHAAREAGIENWSTPAEAIQIMRQLAERSDSAAGSIMATLRLSKASPLVAALTDETNSSLAIASKPGMIDRVRTEWALVEHPDGGPRYVVAIMLDRQAPDRELRSHVRTVAAAIDRYWCSV